jgi:hypothetical protein
MAIPIATEFKKLNCFEKNKHITIKNAPIIRHRNCHKKKVRFGKVFLSKKPPLKTVIFRL